MLYDTIQNICKQKKISISKIENECNIGTGTIGGWKYSSPRIANLQKVADYLNVPIEKLLEDA